MKILIATPAYGGLVTTGYTQSLITTVKEMLRHKVNYAVYTMSNESLIQRARNKMATYAVDNADIDKLFFIDADISWTWKDFEAIIASDKPVIGGTYPLKMLPLRLNFNLLPEHTHLLDRTPSGLKNIAAKFANDKGEIQVRHIPTGFMCVDAKVLRMLATRVGSYRSEDPIKKIYENFYDLFPVGVRDGHLLSEDWMFCEICKENDVPIYMNANVVVDHEGAFKFSAR